MIVWECVVMAVTAGVRYVVIAATTWDAINMTCAVERAYGIFLACSLLDSLVMATHQFADQ